MHTLMRAMEETAEHLELGAALRHILPHMLRVTNTLPHLGARIRDKHSVHHRLNRDAAKCSPYSVKQLDRGLLAVLWDVRLRHRHDAARRVERPKLESEQREVALGPIGSAPFLDDGLVRYDLKSQSILQDTCLMKRYCIHAMFAPTQ